MLFTTSKKKFSKRAGGLGGAILLSSLFIGLFIAGAIRNHFEFARLSTVERLTLIGFASLTIPVFILLIALFAKFFLYQRKLRIELGPREIVINFGSQLFDKTVKSSYEDIRLLTASSDILVIRFKSRAAIWAECLDDPIACFHAIVNRSPKEFVVDQNEKTKVFDAAESIEAIISRRKRRKPSKLVNA